MNAPLPEFWSRYWLRMQPLGRSHDGPTWQKLCISVRACLAVVLRFCRHVSEANGSATSPGTGEDAEMLPGAVGTVVEETNRSEMTGCVA